MRLEKMASYFFSFVALVGCAKASPVTASCTYEAISDQVICTFENRGGSEPAQACFDVAIVPAEGAAIPADVVCSGQIDPGSVRRVQVTAGLALAGKTATCERAGGCAARAAIRR